MKRSKRFGLIGLVCTATLAVDQAGKFLAAKYLPRDQMYSFIGDLFRVGYTENTGAFLGIGGELPPEARFWTFVVLVGALLILLAAYIIKGAKQAALPVIGLSLLFAGGLSNFFDRLIHSGAVVDFLNLGVGSLRTGVFNVADVAIMVGLVLLVWPHHDPRQAEKQR